MPDEKKAVCAKCGSELLQPITNGVKCGACGHQEVERQPLRHKIVERRGFSQR
jgi:DNA-directed RNA polymerase subunit RPC12/RpoP